MDQTIGIQEWRDLARNSYYPFEEDCGVKALFLDATFVQFDGFIPRLNYFKVLVDAVEFSFELDTGEYIHKQPESACVEGSVILLKDEASDRYHGQVVIGPGIIQAFNNMKGVTVSPDLEFSAMAVRAIPRTAGLFAIDQAYNDVTITTDKSQFFEIIGNRVTLNSVSMPSNIPEVRLSSQCIYAITDKKHVVELDLTAHSMKKSFTLANPLTALVTSDNKLTGVDEMQFYNLTAVPATKLYLGLNSIGALTTGYEDQSLLFAVSGNSLLSVAPYEASPNVVLLTLTGASTTLACYQDNDKFVYSIKGPYDKTALATVSDILYTANTTAISTAMVGLITLDGDIHQPPCVGLVKMPDDADNTITGVLANSSIVKVVRIDLTLGTATLLFSTSASSTLGNLVSITDGKNVKVTLRSVTPLKQVNGVAPINNALHFVDSGIIHLQKTGPAEITVNLAPEAEKTIIKRSTKYEV